MHKCSFMQRPHLVKNESARLDAVLWPRSASDSTVLRPTLSTTAHLVRIARPDDPFGDALLGIGHLHRRPSNDNHTWTRATLGYGRRPDATFRFASQYTHFWYALQPQPPFRLIAMSGEFCMVTQTGSDDCESVQFVGGLAGASRSTSHYFGVEMSPTSAEHRDIVMSWGANDCEAKVGRISVKRVWEMMRALPQDIAERTDT